MKEEKSPEGDFSTTIVHCTLYIVHSKKGSREPFFSLSEKIGERRVCGGGERDEVAARA